MQPRKGCKTLVEGLPSQRRWPPRTPGLQESFSVRVRMLVTTEAVEWHVAVRTGQQTELFF